MPVRDIALRAGFGAASASGRLEAISRGDAAELSRVLRECADTVWPACALLAGDDAETRAAFDYVMAALAEQNGMRLRAYTGHNSFEHFIALTARELLAGRLLKLLRDEKHRFWTAFRGFFEPDIARLIRKRMPGAPLEELRRDFHQDICLALIDEDYRRLRAYSGDGSFTGFVLRIVDHLLIDLLRTVHSRRRLPAAVARLPELEREIYKLTRWNTVPENVEALRIALQSRLASVPAASEIAQAMTRVSAVAPLGAVPPRPGAVSLSALPDDGAEQWADPAPSPEAGLQEREEEERLQRAVAALKQAAAELGAAERQYLSIALSGAEPPPAREIARLMGRPVEEIYKIRQRAVETLRKKISGEDAVKKWLASV